MKVLFLTDSDRFKELACWLETVDENVSMFEEAVNLETNKTLNLDFIVNNHYKNISNYFRKQQSTLKCLSMQERTRQSGLRNVMFKTVFPSFMQLILNELVLTPFHILQKINKGNSRSLVLYSEEKPKKL